MDILFILIGINKLIYLDEYVDPTTNIKYSEGYYLFAEPATVILN